LCGREVFQFDFRLGEKQEDDASRNMPVADDAQTAALAATGSRPAELAQPAGAKNEVTSFRICHERPLQGVQFFIRQQFGSLPGEE
jgi:hypothetical protein